MTTILEQYRNWQRDTRRHFIAPSGGARHHCHCCDTDYAGNFCPECGQRAGGKHLTWASVRQGVMDIWGVGSRSLPVTLWQLIWRPGYLIADYIGGRRQVSFPPVKMLVIVGLVVMLLVNCIESSPDVPMSNEGVTAAERYSDTLIDNATTWFGNHYDWTAIAIFSFLIVPTHVIFRHSPRCPRHTLPEGFFIQVFCATQVLMIYPLLMIDFGLESATLENTICFSIIALSVLRTYLQLFGYKLWGTIWRLTTTIVVALLMMIIALLLSYVVYMMWNHQLLSVKMANYVKMLIGAVVCAIILWCCDCINKRHAASR